MSVFKRFGRQGKVVALIANTSVFVPNDRSHHPFCVLPIMWCAFGAHLYVGLEERPTPYRFIGTGDISFSCFREDGRLFISQVSVSVSLYLCFCMRIYVCTRLCLYLYLSVSVSVSESMQLFISQSEKEYKRV